jgi:hypothetical protein
VVELEEIVMTWRLIIVIWVFALLAGVAFYFADDIFALTQHILTLDQAGRERITWLIETGAKVLGILGGILTAVKVFIEGKSGSSPQRTDTSTNSTTFHGKVDVRGDLVGRDKVIHGGRDAG